MADSTTNPFLGLTASPDTSRKIFAYYLGVDPNTYVLKSGDLPKAWYSLFITFLGASDWQQAQNIIETDPDPNVRNKSFDTAWGSDHAGETLAQIPFNNQAANESILLFAQQDTDWLHHVIGIVYAPANAQAGINSGVAALFGPGTIGEAILKFLGFLFSIEGLALIGGAILLYLGYKQLGSGNASSAMETV